MIYEIKSLLSHPIGGKRPLSSLWRVARWQLRSRMSRGTAMRFNWVGGSTLLVRRGDHGLTGNIYCGLHDFSEMSLVLHLLRPGDLFVDVGANLGSYTVLAAAVAGAKVIAFEPQPTNFARLRENIEVNGIADRVEAMQFAVGAEPGQLRFTGSGTTCHLVGPEEAAHDAIDVPVMTLDAALAGREPTMIKIDVEGFESAVIAGAASTLRSQKLRVVIAELIGEGGRYGIDEERIRRELTELGFVAYDYDPIGRSLNPPTRTSGNNIFVRDKDKILPLLATAGRRTLHGLEF